MNHFADSLRSMWVPVLIALLVTALVVRGCGVPEVVTRVVEVTPAALEDSIRALELQVGGLRARLAGIESRPPRIVYRDTTVYVEIPAPACSEVVAMSGRGEFSAGVFSKVDGGWQRSMESGIRADDCDDGWSYGPAGLVCNRPRLGHFSPGVAAGYGYGLDEAEGGLWAAGGLSWRPRYRSNTRIDVLITTRRTIDIGIWKGF